MPSADNARCRSALVLRPTTVESVRVGCRIAAFAAALVLAGCAAHSAALPAGPWVLDVPSIADGSIMRLTIDDQSGRLTEARAATVGEVEEADGLAGDVHIAATAFHGDAESVLVRWIASGCDTTGRVLISSEAGSITVAPGRIGRCDAVGDMRGVVLAFHPAVAPTALLLDLLATPLSEASAPASPTSEPLPTAIIAPTPTPEPLADVLARHNTILTPAEAGSVAVIGEERAVAAAREFYTAGTPTVWLGRLTITDRHLGGADAPLAVEDRLVYVVQLTGLTLYPMGGGWGDPPPRESDVHHEMVVFIDAVTGEFITAVSAR